MKLIAGIVALGLIAVLVVAVGIAVRGGRGDASPGSAEIVLEDLRFVPDQLNAKGAPHSRCASRTAAASATI